MDKWFDIKAATGDSTDVFLYDFIGYFGFAASDLQVALAEIETPRIRLRINSGGGDFFEMVAISNLLRDHPAKVSTLVEGLAASAASYIAIAGAPLVMAEDAYLMIHNPWTIMGGDASELEAEAKLLRKMEGTLANAYARSSKLTKKLALEAMAEETWYTRDEAIEVGFAEAGTGRSQAQVAGLAPASEKHMRNRVNSIREKYSENYREHSQPRSESQPVSTELKQALIDLRNTIRGR